jgi:hypothetical protein
LREIALHILDIAENSIAAGASLIEISVEEDIQNDRLRIVIQDNGRGMDEAMVARITDPFVTSRTTRKVGLGIPLFKAAAEACNGYLQLSSSVGQGTRIEAEFQRSHIDRMPLGDLAGTMLNLIVCQPDIHWLFRYQAGEQAFIFDDEPIKSELAGIPLTEPAVLKFIKATLKEGIDTVRQGLAEQVSSPK